MKMIYKGIISVLLIFAVVFVPQNLYKSLNTDKITEEMYSRREKYYYGVITLWQIDCFEGGTGSRANWLKSIVSGFEKRNNGVYVSIENLSVEMANKLIESGQKKPDIISWGTGVNIQKEQLENLDIENTPQDVIDAVYETAVPWCMGAYFMIGDGDSEKWGLDGEIITTKKAQKTVYSVGVPQRNGYVSLKALTTNCTNSFNDEKALLLGTSQEIFEAYNYSKKVNRMIGTQRDFYRLSQAQTKENARQGEIQFLGYTDLFQYVSVLKCDNEKKVKTMNDFVDFLLEEEQQNNLGSIGMFPVTFSAQPEYDNSFAQTGWESIKKQGIKCSSFVFQKGIGEEEQKKCLEFLQKRSN